ncbi:TyeA family type III secretion system gatekeeper subunit (plasmid) [Enterobacteriaceae bacterium Kacie_13]|nr:TyeA family type III secretion system gatekeeper subunit [Enterobacteriaceae bacterium Kacie_13]
MPLCQRVKRDLPGLRMVLRGLPFRLPRNWMICFINWKTLSGMEVTMAGIDGLGGIFTPQTQMEEGDAPRPFTQTFPARDLQAVAQQSVQNSALSEAMESMSLVMGGRLRQQDRKSDGKDRLSEMRDKLTALIPKMTGPALAELLTQFSQLGSDARNPLEILQQAGVEAGAMVLILSGLLRDTRMDPQRRKRLENALEALLADESIPVDIFALLELGALDKQSLIPVRMLYERCRQQEDSQESLLAWYQEVCDWPEREKRVKVLIQALALPLGQDGDHLQINRIAHTITELKRLLLFFNLAEHSNWVAHASQTDRESVLREVLALLSQIWIYPDWFTERLSTYRLEIGQQIAWVRVMLELIRTLPTLCFRDDEQQLQVLEALEQFQDKLADAE